MFKSNNTLVDFLFNVMPFHIFGGFFIGWSIPGFIVGPTNHAYRFRWGFLSIGLALLIPFIYKVYLVLTNNRQRLTY